MQPQSTKKRNIFRASLRQQYIQSFQRSIRKKYLLLQQQQKYKIKQRQNIDCMVQNLQEIYKLKSQDICNSQHFQYFIQCLQNIGNVNHCVGYNRNFECNGGNNMGEINQEMLVTRRRQDIQKGNKQHRNSYVNYGNYNNYNTVNNTTLTLNNQINRINNRNQLKLTKISGVWKYRQKIYSLLYRILDKAFSQTKGRLWYIIDKALYMLEYPQLMPLWQKISSTCDKKSKNFLAKEFSNKISQSVMHTQSFNGYTNNASSTYNNLTSILDSDFVLDIVSNFTVQSPCIQFQHMLQLIPFITYALNVQKYPKEQPYLNKNTHFKQNIDNKQQNYPKINKICIILRSIIKEDSKIRMYQLVENGYQNIFVFLMEEICRIFGWSARNGRGNSQGYNGIDEEYSQRDQEYLHSSSKSRLQCNYNMQHPKIHNHNRKSQTQSLSYIKKPLNLQITTKLNLIKLLNRIFVANPNIATFLYLKLPPIAIFSTLFSQFLTHTCYHKSNSSLSYSPPLSLYEYNNTQTNNDDTQSNHHIVLKNILQTVYTILMASITVGHNFIDDFISTRGIQLLQKYVQIQSINSINYSYNSINDIYGNNSANFIKQISNIIHALDGIGLYTRIQKGLYIKLMRIQLQLLYNWAIQYIQSVNNKNYQLNTIVSKYLQIRLFLARILKNIRASLLYAYARATQPQIFNQSIEIIMDQSEGHDIIEQLANLQVHKTNSLNNNNNNLYNSNQDQQIRIYANYLLQICQNPKQYIQKYGNNINIQQQYNFNADTHDNY